MPEKDKMTIDITPSWEAAMGVFFVAARDGKREGQIAARIEMRRAGRALDLTLKALNDIAEVTGNNEQVQKINDVLALALSKSESTFK